MPAIRVEMKFITFSKIPGLRLAVLLLLISTVFVGNTVNGKAQTARDGTLSTIRRSDTATKDALGKLPRLSPAEHMRRASVYMSNRAFPEARAHWQAMIDFYPEDSRVAEALFGIARSYFQQKVYDQALAAFERVARDFPSTKEGRESLNYTAATLLRLGRFNEAVTGYIEYITRYPNGERIETAHLNVIDTLREAGRPTEALEWVTRTRNRFAGTVTETNAVFAKLRLHIAENQWREAVSTADQLRSFSFQKGVAAKPDEITYLKAFSLEQSGRKDEAFSVYATVPDSVNTYFGWLATERMAALASANGRSIVDDRKQRVNSDIADAAADYPAPYRQMILKVAKPRNFDPRFVLALMKQESVFRPSAKSPAGARGLLQLTLDAAQKYAPAAGLTGVQESQLYEPEASIRLGVEYLTQLSRMFPQMLEPVAASYNGGEDNVARWLKRARQKNPGIFTSEVGFDETKAYVQKVMSNYRVYKQLYTIDLIRK
jgi:soluble lytic murein transglycosylase